MLPFSRPSCYSKTKPPSCALGTSFYTVSEGSDLMTYISDNYTSYSAPSRLRRLLKHFYKARKSHRTIDSIDTCLASGDVIELMKHRISENEEDQLKGTYYDTSNNKLP